MKFECPHCNQRLAAEAEMVGRQIACPACANTITIPSAAAVADKVTSLTSNSSHTNDQSPLTSSATQAAGQREAGGPLTKRRLPVITLAAVFVLFGLAAA